MLWAVTKKSLRFRGIEMKNKVQKRFTWRERSSTFLYFREEPLKAACNLNFSH